MNAKEFICQDWIFDNEIPNWEEVEENISYDIYGIERLMEQYAALKVQESNSNWSQRKIIQKVKNIIEKVMDKYEKKANDAENRNNDKSSQYNSGVVDGLNHAYH